MGVSQEFQDHLASGLTTLARCWRVERKDGDVFGFTDHDRSLVFDGTNFQADSGITAFALEQGSGLGVDNTETLGALRADGISEDDIAAGLYDGAEVMCWLVNWSDTAQRMVLFAGRIGEITRCGGQFQAEVRGVSEPLNQPSGRAYQKSGACTLGDPQCGVDLDRADFTATYSVEAQENNISFRVTGESSFEDGWFTHGIMIHEARGLRAVIKSDERLDDGRLIELWTPLSVRIEAGDIVRLIVGCDGQFSTCRFKFANQLNFRGFPDIPGDEWITTVPRGDGLNDGGSLR